MSTTLPQVSQALRHILGEVAQQAAKEAGFSQRQSKLDGAVFLQTLVFGWLNNPQASLQALSQTSAALGVKVTPQALDQRFSLQAAHYIQQVMQAALRELIYAEPAAVPILERFRAIIVQDSSTVALPQELSPLWPGCGGSGAKATIKLSVSPDLTWGVLAGPLLTGGRCHDQQAATQQAQLPQGALRLADLGYFNLDAFAQMSAQGVYYLSRFKVGTKLFGEDGAELELPRALHQLAPSFDIKVELGQRHRLSARLMGLRVPQEVAAQRRRRLKDRARKKSQQPSKAQLNLCEWTLLVTNAPVELIRLQEALVLAQARWQIELLFKLWKQYGQIDAWASQKPVRILCELSAKLLAMIIQHWVLLVSCWSYPDRSLMKAAQTVQSYATMMASALAGLIELDLLLSHVARCISLGCRLNRRRKRPSTCQLLLNLTQEPLN